MTNQIFMLLPPLLCIPFSHVCTYDSNDDIVSWLVAASVIDYNAVIDVPMYVTMLVNLTLTFHFTHLHVCAGKTC